MTEWLVQRRGQAVGHVLADVSALAGHVAPDRPVGHARAARELGQGVLLPPGRQLCQQGLGVEEVLLYVESDNAPAVRVYSGLGFTHAAADTHVQYRRP